MLFVMEIALGESYLPHTLQGNSPSLAIGMLVVLPMPASNLGVVESADVAIAAFAWPLQLLPF